MIFVGKIHCFVGKVRFFVGKARFVVGTVRAPWSEPENNSPNPNQQSEF